MRNAGRFNWGLRVLGTIVLTTVVHAKGLADDSPKPRGAPPPMKKIEDFAPPEEFVMAGGVKTHFLARGRKGLPVVLVHGFGSSTYSWTANLDALSQSHRVFALDLKGFGLTAKPKDGVYHLKEYARHLLAFLDEMKLEKAVLVGHSMGGAVVTRLALLHPERVSGLVLVDAAPAGDLGPLLPIKKDDIAGTLLNSSLSSQILSSILKTLVSKERIEPGLKGSFHDPSKVTPEMLEHIYRPFTIEGAPEALAAMVKGMARMETKLPPVSTLRMPVLILWGRHDRQISMTYFDDYAKTIPNVQTAIFEKSGHIPHEEEPEAFNARVLEFLGGLPSSKSTPKSE